MTARDKDTLKSYFNTGDTITEANIADFIDTVGIATLTVAASNASSASKGRADYVCDGTADEVEIQAAVNALPAGGGRVLLTEGTFNLVASQYTDFGAGFDSDACILIDENDGDIEISGIAGTILKLTANQPANASMLMIGGVVSKRTRRTVVTGIEFDGNAANQINNWLDFGIISLVRTDYVLIKNCYVHSWKSVSSGIYSAWGSQRIIISNNRLKGNDNSLRLHNSLHSVIGNLFEGTVGATSGAMIGLIVDEVGFGQANSINVTGNLFYGGYTGIYLQGCISSVVAQNTFSTMTNATAYPIKLSEYDDGSVLRFDAKYISVFGNTIYNCSAGIRISGNTYGVKNCLIAFNSILDGPDTNIGYGIRLSGATCNNNILAYNVIDTSAITTIENTGTGTVIKDNVGYVTEKTGVAASVADGGTIAHGISPLPTKALVQATVAGEFASVTALDANNITVAIKKHDNTAGTTQTIYWEAYA